MKATESQKKMLIDLLLKKEEPETANKNTLAALVRRDWYDIENDVITEAGMGAAEIPTRQQPICELLKDVPYQNTTLPKGTKIMVTLGGEVNGMKLVEGLINFKGEPRRILIYKPIRANWYYQMMPDLKEMGIE